MNTLIAARQQMALSLGWHIVIACFGVAFPSMVLLAEWRAHRHGDDPVLLALARRWSKVFGVLFAVGAVSGTILSFEFGILWPEFMATYGDVFGVPFAMEGFAFFLEGIFIGIYLYGWDRLSRRAHLLTGIPIIISGILATIFVVSVNSWMNHPRGFDIVDGEVVNIDPWAPLWHTGTAVQATHMLLAAFMVAGFVAAMPYAWAWLKGRRTRYYRLGFLIPFVIAAVATPIQLVAGDTSARWVASQQPVKLAAMEGLYETQSDAPESLGGFYYDDELHYAIEIPCGLSFLIDFNCDYEVQGLESVPEEDRPPVNVVHLAFDLMVGIGTALFALVSWFAFVWWRRRRKGEADRMPQSPWFYRAAILAGPATILALWAGWTVTEVGRQPWVVYEIMRTEDAVTSAGGIPALYAGSWVIYLGLTAALLFVLRKLAKTPIPDDVVDVP